MTIKQSIQALGAKTKAVLMFAAAVLPPVIVLFQEQSTNPFLYGSAICGGALVFVLELLNSSD
jgi:ATP-dependent phosphoenolpyruvate carboxykinase